MQSETNSGIMNRWFKLCPFRHVVCLVGLIIIGLFHLLRDKRVIMQSLSLKIVHPWHRMLSRLCGNFDFSVAECLIALLVIFLLAYLVYSFICLFQKRQKLHRCYRIILTCLSLFLIIYAGFCLFWGTYYYSSDFEDQSGIYSEQISTEQLSLVTQLFIKKVNYYNTLIERDASGQFVCDLNDSFQKSDHLYDAIEQKYPCLMGDSLRAKPIHFSRIMSYTNFTGFFFPFTGEANINIDAPECFVPSTIAHEIAHQRGVAEEDEANFVAVLASLEDGDPVFCYSSCLLAYLHLGNALYKANYDEWANNYSLLDDGPKIDLSMNNEYWEQFETPVSTVSDTVYTDFLVSYGQTLGLQTYGKCVDLLVTYYLKDAEEVFK